MYIAITLFAPKMQIKCRITKYPLLKRRSFIPIPLYHTQYICPFILLFKEIATICRRILIFSNTPLPKNPPKTFLTVYLFNQHTQFCIFIPSFLHKYTPRPIRKPNATLISLAHRIYFPVEPKGFRSCSEAFGNKCLSHSFIFSIVFHFLEMCGFLYPLISQRFNQNVNGKSGQPLLSPGNTRFSAIRKYKMSFCQRRVSPIRVLLQVRHQRPVDDMRIHLRRLDVAMTQ